MVPSEFLGDHAACVDVELDDSVAQLLHDLRFLGRIVDRRERLASNRNRRHPRTDLIELEEFTELDHSGRSILALDPQLARDLPSRTDGNGSFWQRQGNVSHSHVRRIIRIAPRDDHPSCVDPQCRDDLADRIDGPRKLYGYLLARLLGVVAYLFVGSELLGKIDRFDKVLKRGELIVGFQDIPSLIGDRPARSVLLHRVDPCAVFR